MPMPSADGTLPGTLLECQCAEGEHFRGRGNEKEGLTDTGERSLKRCQPNSDILSKNSNFGNFKELESLVGSWELTCKIKV
jgi:hypothetical protein